MAAVRTFFVGFGLIAITSKPLEWCVWNMVCG